MSGSQKPDNPMDQQRLMEDILKGRLTIAQLAELQTQRRLQQEMNDRGGQLPQSARPGATRIATERIEPDHSLPNRPVQTRTSLGQAATPRVQRPAPMPRSPSGPETRIAPRSRRVPIAIPNTRPPTERRPAPATAPAASRTPITASPKPPSSVGSDHQKTTGGGDKPATASVVPINQQIHRILASHRGARTA